MNKKDNFIFGSCIVLIVLFTVATVFVIIELSAMI